MRHVFAAADFACLRVLCAVLQPCEDSSVGDNFVDGLREGGSVDLMIVREAGGKKGEDMMRNGVNVIAVMRE